MITLEPGARIRPAERGFEIVNGPCLHLPEPRLIQRWQLFQACAQLCRLCQTFDERFRPRKGENLSTARRGVEPAREVRHRSVGLQQKWQRASVRRQIIGQARSILR